MTGSALTANARKGSVKRMADKENIKMGLEEVSDFFFKMYRKETDEYKAAKAKEYCDIAEDALVLLKKQEAIEPDVDSEGTCSCGNCGTTIGYYPAGCSVPEKLCKYCPECGQAVKWNEP